MNKTVALLFSMCLAIVPVCLGQRAIVVKHKAVVTIPMTIDGSVHGVAGLGSSSATSVAVTIGTPTAGDAIVCEFSFSHSSTFVSVADNVNAGNYSAGAPVAPASPTVYQSFQGIYFKNNVAASPTTITLTYTTTTAFASIACQALKPSSAGNLHVDSAFTQQQNGTTANPTTGSALTPTYSNEIVFGFNTRYHTSATAGAGFALIDSSSNAYQMSYPEYVIQTTAVSSNAPFTGATDSGWGDQQAAFSFQ